MQQKLLVVCLGMIVSIQSQAQIVYSLGNDAAYIARLEGEARQARSDSIRSYTYLKLSLMCKRINDTTKARNYFQQGIRLSTGYPFLQAASQFYKVIGQFGQLDLTILEKRLVETDSVLKSFTYPEAYKLRSIIWHNYGIIRQIRGDEKGAIAAFTNKAAPYARLSGDGLVQGKNQKGIAIVSMNADQRTKAASYLEQAIRSIETAPSDNPIRTIELVETYIIAGENYVYLNQCPLAIRVLTKAKKVLSTHPSSNLYLIYYYAEGIYFDKLKQYTQAIQSFDKGIAMATRLNAGHSLNRLKYVKYKTLSNQKAYKNAASVLKELVQSSLVFETDKKLYYQEMYQTYASLGDTREAFEWAKKYITLSDSLYRIKFQKDIIELETKYKNAENQKQIASLQAEKDRASLEVRNNRLLSWLLGATSLFSLLTAVFASILYRNSRKLALQKEVNYQQQLKDTQQQQQIQLTRALMQGEEKERKRLAIDLHDGLGGMLAGIKINLSRLATSPTFPTQELTGIITQLDASAHELRRIARNLMPESLLQLGLESALNDMCESMSTAHTEVIFQAFGLDTHIPKETQVNIYRIVQELLTNAIRHADASEILVQCSQNDTKFFITLEDNGKGFDTATNNTRNGIGLTNVQSRVDYLKGKLDIVSTAAEGTTITIEFDVTA